MPSEPSGSLLMSSQSSEPLPMPCESSKGLVEGSGGGTLDGLVDEG